jgi:hypothetical protein
MIPLKFLTKANTKQPNSQGDPFSDEGISKEPKKIVPVVSQPPGPPSDNSSSDSESELAKLPIPSQSTQHPILNQSIITLI